MSAGTAAFDGHPRRSRRADRPHSCRKTLGAQPAFFDWHERSCAQDLQLDSKDRAAAGSVASGDASAVGLDHRATDRQAQPSTPDAIVWNAEEFLEDSGLVPG